MTAVEPQSEFLDLRQMLDHEFEDVHQHDRYDRFFDAVVMGQVLEFAAMLAALRCAHCGHRHDAHDVLGFEHHCAPGGGACDCERYEP